MSRDDTVALTLDRQTAREVLAGKCLHREHLEVLQSLRPRETDVMLIVKRDEIEDPHAIANALVLALGVLPRAMVIDADAPVPEGFAHHHFVEVGEDATRNTRGQMVHEIIPPVRFCD